MCNHPKCIYIDILEMTNGEKLYIHYDTNQIPIFIQYNDEHRNIEREYIMKGDGEANQNIRMDISEREELPAHRFIVYDGIIELKPDEIIGTH